MRGFFNILFVAFATVLGYMVASRIIEDTRDFR